MAAYKAIRELSSGKGYPVAKLCKCLSITRSAYYHWIKYPKSNNELQNEKLFIEIKKIHTEHPDMGYRRIRDELDGHKGIHVNDKRVLRICRKCDIKSNIKWKPKSCTRGERNPDHVAKIIYIGIFMPINQMRSGSLMYLNLNTTVEMKFTRYI